MHSAMKRSTWLFTSLGMTLSLIVSSFAGTSYYGFIEEPVVSDVIGMGASGTATGMGGFTFYNPAGLSLKKKPFIRYDFTRLYEDLGRGYIESGWVFPNWFIGGSFQTQSVKSVERTDITGIIEGAYVQNHGTTLSLLTGIKRERYSLAVSLNGVQEIIGDYNSYGASGSIGLIVNIVEDHITAGVAAIHLAGRHTAFRDREEKWKSERFPATIRAGACLKDSLFHKFPTTVSVDVVYNYNDELITVPVGVDFRILPPVSLQIGKRFNHPSDLFSMGVGFNWKNIAFDASFTPFKYVSDLFVKRSVGLTYSLPSPRSSEQNKNISKPKEKRVKKSEENGIGIVPEEIPIQLVPVTIVPSDTVTKEQVDTAVVADTLSDSSAVDSTKRTVPDTTQQDAVQKEDSVPAAIIPTIDSTATDTLFAADSSKTSPEIKPAVESESSAKDLTGKPVIDSSAVPVTAPRDSSGQMR